MYTTTQENTQILPQLELYHAMRGSRLCNNTITAGVRFTELWANWSLQ